MSEERRDELKVRLDELKAKTAWLLSTGAAVLGLAVGIVVAFGSYSEFSISHDSDYTRKKAMVAELQARSDIEDLRSKLKTVDERLSEIVKVPADTAVSAQIHSVVESVQDLKKREDALENAILNSPVKALEIPLIRRDLDNLKEKQTDIAAEFKDGVDRVYDLNKWLLGAMAVSVVGLALNNLLKKGDSPPVVGGGEKG